MSEERPIDAPAPEPAAAPAEPAPLPPSAVEPSPAPAPATAPQPQPEPVPAEPATPAIKPHTDEPGLLQATPVEGEKPAEAAPEKPAETPVAPEAPAYEFSVPEGFTVPAERMEEAQSVLRESGVPKEQAEKLWGMHTAAMQEFAQHTLQAQHDAFAEMRRGWRNEILSDPELGGAGYETNKATANRILDKLTESIDGDAEKTAKNRAEFNQFLSMTGATDHPALFRALLRLSRYLTEPQGGPPPAPSPLPVRDAMGRRPRGMTAGERTNSGGATRIEYDHPRGAR